MTAIPEPIGHDTLAVVNATVFDGHNLLDADTIVIRDGIVTAITKGPADIPSGAETFDAGGGLVTPGFVDAHVHTVFGGIEALQVDLSGCASATESLATIREALAADLRAGTGGWLTGGGWSMSDFPGGAPQARLLDDLCAELGVDRPIQLANADHHSMWVNSAALRIAGIGPTTPTPPGGIIDRDQEGRPTGTLHESAVSLIDACIPPETPDQLRAGLLEGQCRLHGVGITGYIDALVGAEYMGHGDNYHAYLAAEDAGELTCEVNGSLWWGRQIADPQAEADRLAALQVVGPRFRATTVKFMLDGIVESGTAAMATPYCCPCQDLAARPGTTHTGTVNHGTSYFTRDHLDRAFAALAHHRFDIHCHAIGDAAVKEALDALETLHIPVADDPGSGLGDHDQQPWRPRHHIAHLEVVDPVDVPRMAQLGITANMQALWAHYDQQLIDLNLPVLGPERSRWLYPFGDIARSGARLAMGSDWPVSTPDPWQAIHVAVTRTHPTGARPDPLNPEQALDLTTCLRAYTTGSARLARSRTAGHLALGAPADLAVASVNPFTLPPDQICTVHNTLTVAAGRVVHIGQEKS